MNVTVPLTVAFGSGDHMFTTGGSMSPVSTVVRQRSWTSPVAPVAPSTAIRYVSPGLTSSWSRLHVAHVLRSARYQPCPTSPPYSDSVYARSDVSNELPSVVKIAVPELCAVQRYQIEWPSAFSPAVPSWRGSLTSTVAPTFDAVRLPQSPVSVSASAR